MITKRHVIDEDTTDDFLDAPAIVYRDGSAPATGEDLDRLADPRARRADGLPPLPALPPITDA